MGGSVAPASAFPLLAMDVCPVLLLERRGRPRWNVVYARVADGVADDAADGTPTLQGGRPSDKPLPALDNPWIISVRFDRTERRLS